VVPSSSVLFLLSASADFRTLPFPIMSIPENNPFATDTEAQLQEELSSLFIVDTQHYLQRYTQIAQQLHADSWKGDIQELYRCVHTIKGGAVTVAAESILHVATALEDLLADLRYLDLSPSLADGHLNQALLEAGELLTGSLELQGLEETQPILRRIETLHQEIRDRYLTQWNEQKQLHQEFAEQGFDLVVLELEVALERLPQQGTVPTAVVNTAQQTLAQLQQIGNELQFAAGWTTLLNQAQTIFDQPENRVWRSQWLQIFQALKTCAKQSGTPVSFEFADPEFADLELVDLEFASLPDGQTADYLDFPKPVPTTEPAPAWSDLPDLQESFTELGSFLDELPLPEGETSPAAEIPVERMNDLVINPAIDPVTEPTTNIYSSPTLEDLPDLAEISEFLDTFNPSEAANLPDPPNLSTSIDDFDRALPSVDLREVDYISIATDPDINTDAVLNPESGTNLEVDLDTDLETIQGTDLGTDLDASLGVDFSTDLITDSNNDLVASLSASWITDFNAALGADLGIDLNADLGPENLGSESLGTDLNAAQTWLEPPLSTDAASLLSAVPSPSAPNPPSSVPGFAQPPRSTKSGSVDGNLGKVQIPVPLEKLDRSSQYLVETLLSLRTTQGFYQTLQTQIMQLVSLAQEGVQYVTHLRQIQDDYALLNDLRGDLQTTTQGPTPERYRQGYTVINRLLETSLRLSEIGAETGKTAQQITENLRNVDTSVLKLQTTVEESRLVPFQNLTFRARAILRDLVTRYGKPARLVVQGEKTELDINTARNLEPALLHLIRNAYDHGLEPVSDRTAQGKPAQGTLSLSLQRQGNTFQLEFADDGGGIDASMIQARAESLNLPLTQTQTPSELLSVLCQPGFTSETQVSEISGRGVGMDVVAVQVSRLGGRLSLHTMPGTGTTFRIQFPVPRLLVPCLLLQAGNQTFAIPLDDIRTTTLLDTLNVSRVKEPTPSYSWVIENESGATPALDLLEYWEPRFAGRSLSETAVCVYVQPQTSPVGIWLVADELVEQSELIITPLPPPLVAPDGLIGVSLQTNGTVVPVLEAGVLAERLLTCSVELSQSATPSYPLLNQWETEHSTQTVLIVDDAALMRRRLESSLNAYGYVTHTCADGREAWNWLQNHPTPRLVITDIEMPNMDGFTLVDRCRQTGITAPILVISSRLSEEWFDEARRLGASDYLTKGFSTNELLDKVDTLLKTQD
jgi:chemosensory pili system protein ChpA (sensor histidine kinase/response regulator)